MWHHAAVWEENSKQETFYHWCLSQVKWQSSGRLGWLLQHCSLRDRCHILCKLQQEAFCMAAGQLFGYDILPIHFDHDHHWLLYKDIHVLSYLTFYLISPLIWPWRLLIHRDIYSRSRKSLKAKILLQPRLEHWRDKAEMKVASSCSTSNQTFRLVGSCLKNQKVTLLW